MPGLNDNLDLPDGWTAEAVPSFKDHIVISAPAQAGMITIDLGKRVFRLGYTMTGRPDTRSNYEGRGWKKALIADAVSVLRSAIT